MFSLPVASTHALLAWTIGTIRGDYMVKLSLKEIIGMSAIIATHPTNCQTFTQRDHYYRPNRYRVTFLLVVCSLFAVLGLNSVGYYAC